MDKEKLREETIANIRGCLVSVKGKVELRQLIRDYNQIMGTSIPFRELGYLRLEEFLKSISSLTITKNFEGQILIDAKSNEKTSHISTMVSRQKTTKKIRKIAPRYQHSKTAPMYLPNPLKWKPKNFSDNKKIYENSPRPAAINHSQFVNFTKERVPQTNFPKKPLTTINNNTLVKPPPSKVDITYKRKFSFNKEPSTESDSSPNNPSLTSKHSFTKTMAPISPVLSPNCQPFVPRWYESNSDGIFRTTGDHISDLYEFAKFRDLSEPIYKVMERQAKPHKPKFVDVQVKIDGLSHSSYPQDFTDEFSAKLYVSKIALDKVIDKYGTSKRNSLLLSNEEDVLTRIPPLVKKHYYGIWSWQLEEDYRDLYKEQLPSNWLEIIDMSPIISVEAFNGKYVLRFCKPEDLLQKGKFSSIPLNYDVSIPTSSVQFGDQGMLVAYITCAVSAKEIWCRQIETAEAEAYDKMMHDMEFVYNKQQNLVKPNGITKGRYYAAYVEDTWCRVRVLEIEANEVQCLLVDHGDDMKIPIDNLYQLRREFAKEPAQAFICRLAGLEELYDVSIASEHLQRLEDNVVQLEPLYDDVDSNKYDPVCVIIHDLETGQIVNQELISLISVENALPVLHDRAPNRAHVSNIESNGDIYIQIRSFGYEKLVEMLLDLQTTLTKRPLDLGKQRITPENSKDVLYCTKTENDTKYCRVKIVDWAPTKNFAQIYYVDVGHTRVIQLAKSTLYPLDEISSVVSRFPEQALRIRLDIEEIPNDFEKLIKEHLRGNDEVILRTVHSKDGIPHVKMFVQLESGDLVSVNDSIQMKQPDQKKTNFKTEIIEKLISLDIETQKNVPSTGHLKCPTLPAVGQYFDVKIPCAVNPWNFFVQPYNTNNELTNLMTKLQLRYSVTLHSPLTMDDIQPGKIYVSKHEDNIWYRTSVIKVIHPGSISVFYCDFGYYANLRLQQLVPLDPEFLELPYQAIKAKLSGIKPKQEKWTMDDCKFFQKQVCKKNFVSILVAIEKDELYRLDNVLCLKLIDTSTEVDIHIDNLLVQKQIAVKVNK